MRGQVSPWDGTGTVTPIRVGAGGTAPSFVNGWTNSGGAAQPLHFYRTPYGEVVIQGRIKSGASGTVVFTLPVDFWPTTVVAATALAQGGLLAYTIVNTDGTVSVTNPNSNDTAVAVHFLRGV